MAETLNNFGCYYFQGNFYLRNYWKQILEVSLFYPALILILILLLMLLFFLSKSNLSINQDKSDLLTDSFSFIFALFISFVNLSKLSKMFILNFRYFYLIINFLARLLTLNILFSTVLTAAPVTKPVILGILPSISVTLEL